VRWQLSGKKPPHAAIIIFYYPANYGDSILLPASNPFAEFSVFLPYWSHGAIVRMIITVVVGTLVGRQYQGRILILIVDTKRKIECL
jgi:hypothetical protein